MKVGEQIPVTIAGQTVCMAEVRELGDGTATLIVPAVRVVMATRTELTAETPESGGTVELLTDGVEQAQPAPEAVPAVTEATPAPVVNTEQAPTPVANGDAADVENASGQTVEQVAPAAPVEAPVADNNG